MNLSGHYPDTGLHPGSPDLNAQNCKKIPDMPVGTVTMQALESTYGPTVVRLEISSAAVNLVSMFSNPGTGNIMLAITQWRLVSTYPVQGDELRPRAAGGSAPAAAPPRCGT